MASTHSQLTIAHAGDHLLQGLNVRTKWESTEESRPIEKGHIGPVSSDIGWLPQKL